MKKPSIGYVFMGIILCGLTLSVGTPSLHAVQPQQTIPLPTSALFLPLISQAAPTLIPTAPTPETSTPTTPTPTALTSETPTPEVTPTPALDLIWDPRLDQRGARLILATVLPGQGYWRLKQGIWFNTSESQGRHHIFIDTLDESGKRQTNVEVVIQWSDGATTVSTAAKPGEAYAADFPMFARAPAYNARPNDGAPADEVVGMGLGELDDPDHGHHTSYGLTWQWTFAGATLTPEATATSNPLVTVSTPGVATTTPTVTLPPTLSPLTPSFSD